MMDKSESARSSPVVGQDAVEIERTGPDVGPRAVSATRPRGQDVVPKPPGGGEGMSAVAAGNPVDDARARGGRGGRGAAARSARPRNVARSIGGSRAVRVVERRRAPERAPWGARRG